MTAEQRTLVALDVAGQFGVIDGAHHKQWVIDQMVRALAGDGYAQWVADFCDGEDGPETYTWDEGIAP
jgi:3-methyladenine DNA glycosylase AlkC